MNKEEILSRITQRRLQIAVHSVIYYRFNDNIIDDHKFDRWSKELAELQSQFPDLSKQAIYYEDFKDFDGSTGFQFSDKPYFVGRAERLMMLHKRRN